MRNHLFLLILVLALASCSKDDRVQPCDGSHVVDPAVSKGSTAFTKSGAEGEEDPGTGTISDDGDDVSDGEGRRKKKKP